MERRSHGHRLVVVCGGVVGETVKFRRVPYDRRKTQDKLSKLPLDEETTAWLLERLELGE